MDEIDESMDESGERQFSYRASKDGTVFIAWHGKTVTMLKGEAARRLLAKVEGADDETAELAMAKATGNFKRGNERVAKQKSRRG
ncbi:MAG TPA: hypothetical protein VGE07_06570 [Herpetosiphonaceae bacterium]